MRSLVQNLLAPKTNPIGIDFGTDFLRIVQVHEENGQLQMAAVAGVEVPSWARQDETLRADFFTEAMRCVLASGKFTGRRVMLALPAASMFIQHLRLPKMSEDELAKALPWEMRGKLPIEPSHAVLRHMVAGEIFTEQEPKNEVILMAARRDAVERLLNAAHKAKLDVVGMNVEISAILDCFSHVYRRKGDAEAVNCFVDIGNSGTRAIIGRGSQVLFARCIAVGTHQIDSVIASDLKISIEQARQRRRQMSAQPIEQRVMQLASVGGPGEEIAEPDSSAPEPAIEGENRRQDLRDEAETCDAPGTQVEKIYSDSAEKLITELKLCRRYHEATFPGQPIQRLIFVGGEGANRGFCQRIAQGVGLPAQIGDPLVRIGRGREMFTQAGLEGKLPQPGWAVAIGLSAGNRGGVV